MSKLKNYVFNILIALASCLLLIAALEFTARLVFPEIKVRLIGGDLFVKGKSRPRSMVPNYKGELISAEYNVDVTTNSMGFRDFEYSIKKGPNVYRIIVVGDSFTWGWGVELEDTYPKVLEQLLKAHARDGIIYEVINLGMPNTGTLEETYIIKEGLKYKPDLLLVGFLAEYRWSRNGNDLYDNAIYQNQLKKNLEKNGSARDVDQPLLSKIRKYSILHLNKARLSLQKHSRGFYYLMMKGGTLLRKSLVGMREGGYEKELEVAWDITKSAFTEINTMARRNHFNVVILRIPFLYDVLTKDADKVSHILSDFSRSNELLFLDLLPALHRQNDNDLYYPADGHLTPLAHKVVAEGIYDFIVSENILRTRFDN